MLKRRIGFFLLMGLALFMLLYSGSEIYLWVILFQLFVLFAGALSIVLTYICLSFVQTLEPETAVSGERVLMHIEVHNEFAVPFCHLVLRVGTVRSAFDGEARRYYASVSPFSRERADVEIACPYRGVYDVGVLEVEATDIFGLLKWRRRIEKIRAEEKKTLLVYPRCPELGRGSQIRREDEGSMEDPFSRAAELSSVAEIRDFREGDPLKRIHWKLSARQQKLLVKEFEGTVAAESVIVLDCTEHGLKGEAAAQLEDTMTETAAAFAKRFCDDFRALHLVTYSDERREVSGGTPGDFQAIYTHLAKVPFGGSTSIASAIALESETAGGTLESLVLITGEPSDELFERLCALAVGGCQITLILCLAEEDYPERLIRMLSEFKNRGITAAAILPGDDIAIRMEGLL